MKYYITLFVSIVFSNLMAQNIKIPETREIVLNSADTIQKIRIFIENPNVRRNATKFYAWYQKQTVLQTQGSWSGKLLQGKYESFYPNHNLLEQGYYERGWKKGEWKKWYSNGILKEKANWKSGQKQGAFELYALDGTLAQKGTYLNDKLHGVLISIIDNKELKEKYRNGKLIIKKEKLKKEKTTKITEEKVVIPKKEEKSKKEITQGKVNTKKEEKISNKTVLDKKTPLPKEQLKEK